VLLTVICALIYIVSTTAGFFGPLGVLLNQDFIDRLSIGVFSASAVLCFLITVADNAAMDRTQITDERQRDFEAFTAEFDGLGEGN